MRSRVVTQLFDTHAAALTLYAATWCRSPEDAVQEAFYDLSIIERWPDKPKSWLYTVTRRKALNFSRSEARQRHHAHRASQQTSGWFGAEDDNRSNDNFNVDAVHAALKKLEPDKQEIVVARVWGELSFDELATMLGCSNATAFRRYQSALQELKNTMDQEK